MHNKSCVECKQKGRWNGRHKHSNLYDPIFV